MNRLTTEDRARILTVLSEGFGINAACRMTGASKNTVLKLIADVGEHARSTNAASCATCNARNSKSMRFGRSLG